jgi:hypothetical protein
VRIGLSPLIDARLLTQVLEPYKAAHSGVEIFYKECFLGDLEERLDKEQTDIMLRALLPDEKPSRAGSICVCLFNSTALNNPPPSAPTRVPLGALTSTVILPVPVTRAPCADGILLGRRLLHRHDRRTSERRPGVGKRLTAF